MVISGPANNILYSATEGTSTGLEGAPERTPPDAQLPRSSIHAPMRSHGGIPVGRPTHADRSRILSWQHANRSLPLPPRTPAPLPACHH